MSRFRLALIAVFTATLAACSTSDIVISGYGAGGLPYDPSYVRYMMAQGDIPLEIHGNPSALSDGAFVELVESRLRLDPAFGRAAFRTDPTRKNRHPFRVVLVFNADNTRIDPNQVCRGEGLEKAGGVNATLNVRGVFCDRSTVLSTNSGLANTPDDFGGKRFGRLLDLLLFEMMPAEGNRDVDENCPNTATC
ncbi:MAG: hypothetical protein VW999_03205 [Alphaproteobacteria bacterium]